jgi:hypothetical protein
MLCELLAGIGPGLDAISGQLLLPLCILILDCYPEVHLAAQRQIECWHF